MLCEVAILFRKNEECSSVLIIDKKVFFICIFNSTLVKSEDMEPEEPTVCSLLTELLN